jgi:hypothetical protein
MKRLTSFFLASMLLMGSTYSQSRQFSAEELRADFTYLRQKLETKHPCLYNFTTKAAMDTFLDSLFQQINAPATETAFYNLISSLNEKIRDGHTMFLPEAAYSLIDSARFFPFYVDVQGDRMYVAMNCSSDTAIAAGAEILGINGVDAREILRFLMARQIRDGRCTTYSTWILDNYFKSYYGFSFGHPDSFVVAVRDKLGREASAHVPALPNDRIRSVRKTRYPNNRLASRQGGVALGFDTANHAAVLTLGTFDGKTLRETSGRSVRKTFRAMFESIKKQGSEHLVLDLRDNQGGDFQPSRLLLKYLIHKPARYMAKGFESRRISPKRKGFKGKLYVLINGGSFSASAITCSFLQGEGRAVFIGEETGGNRVAIPGGAKRHVLPNTRIHAYITRKIYHIQDEANDFRGVMPDYEAIPAPEEVGTGEDSMIRMVMGLIGKEAE